MVVIVVMVRTGRDTIGAHIPLMAPDAERPTAMLDGLQLEGSATFTGSGLREHTYTHEC